MKLPNYYSVIPAEIRYHKDLSFFEIVLYSEISALANMYGYAYASNTYFSKLYDKHVSTISKAISKLEKLGFVFPYIDQTKGNERRLYLDKHTMNAHEEYRRKVKKHTPIGVETNTPIGENTKTPIGVNAKQNNKLLNNQDITRSIQRKEEEDRIRELRIEEGEKIKKLFNEVYYRYKK